MLLRRRHLMYAALFGIIAIRAKVCVRARQRYGRRVERNGVHVRELGLAVVVHDVVEVVTSYTAVMLHVLRVALDGQLQPQYLVGHRLHGLGCGRVRALSCERVRNHGLAVCEVGQQGVDGFGCFNHLRKTVGVRHIILIRAGIAVAHGEVVSSEVDGRHVDLDFGDVGHLVAVTVYKLDAELRLAELVLYAIGIHVVWEAKMWFPLQCALAHTMAVKHEMDAAVGFPEAVDVLSSYTRGGVRVGFA